MTPERLRKNLILLRERLTNAQMASRNALKSESGRFTATRAPINMAEQASEEQELDLIASRLNASTETLAKIDEAIDRVDAGHFNTCEECKGEIGERRLTIQPWAKLCVQCQKKLEEDNA